jgi:hypothetical protein
MHVLVRLVMVAFGLVAAAVCAGAAIVLIESWGLPVPSDVTDAEARYAMGVHTIIIGGFALFYGIGPGLLAALIAELLHWRSLLLFATVGALIGVAPLTITLPAWMDVQFTGEPISLTPMTAYPAAGIVAGCVYWLIAGCRAGFFTPTATPPSRTS